MLRLARFVIDNPLYSLLLAIAIAAGGLLMAPFGDLAERIGISPLAIGAIPNIGDNQQIVYCKWPGFSPEDVESQIVFPLTTALMGIPQVEHIRANSMFGFASIHLIFEEGADFYWCRPGTR